MDDNERARASAWRARRCARGATASGGAGETSIIVGVPVPFAVARWGLGTWERRAPRGARAPRAGDARPREEQASSGGEIIYTTSCRCLHRADDAESAPTQTPDRRTRRAGPRAHRSPWRGPALRSIFARRRISRLQPAAMHHCIIVSAQRPVPVRHAAVVACAPRGPP